MVAAGIESINHAQPAADEAQLDDAFSYNLGANYNAGWAKFFLYGQISRITRMPRKRRPSIRIRALTVSASTSAQMCRSLAVRSKLFRVR